VKRQGSVVCIALVFVLLLERPVDSAILVNQEFAREAIRNVK
jgi:hypothetical protein